MRIETMLLTAFLIIILYQVFVFRLQQFMQPLRLEMARVGEALLGEEDLSERDRVMVESSLDFAYSSWEPWQFVAFVPGAALRVMAAKETPSDPSPKRLQPQVHDFSSRALVSMFANSPLATAVFILELLVLVIFAIPLQKLLKQVFEMLDGHSGGGSGPSRHGLTAGHI